MTRQINKAQLLKDIAAERKRLEKTISALTNEDLIRAGVVGIWSVKDVLAHLAAWERLFLDWYRAGVEGRSPSTKPVGRSRKAIDALNKAIFDHNQSRGLDDIAAEFSNSYSKLMEVVALIPEEELFVPGRFDWTGSLTLADYLAGNTCNHYAWANAKIRDWLENKTS